MTQLHELINWLEERIDELRDDSTGISCVERMYVAGRREEAKFILKHAPVSSAEVAEAGTEKLKPAEWIERVLYVWGGVLVRLPISDNATGSGVVTQYVVEVGGMQRLAIALETPVDWSEDK